MNAKLLEAIKKSAAVPSVPQVVTRFLEIMQDPGFEYDDLVKVLSADAGTVSEILRLVNSALFGVRHKIVSLRQALPLLGPMRTRSLLVGRYLVDTMSKKNVQGLDMSYFWRRSLASSVVASRFAEAVLPRHRDEAFISALLADIGIPILAEAMPDRYRPIAARYAPRGVAFNADDEMEAVELTHAELSAMVLTHWALPEVVCKAVNLHQSTNPGEGDAAAIARLLSASDSIARLLCEIPDTALITSVCTEATAFIGGNVDLLIQILPNIESDVEELADVLRIDVIPSNVYALIAKTIQDKLREVSVAG
ncbi:MAG: HDOD domain-containing protein [Planctomycetes bacterium]|nr:HDOD domain-containing protein [Planctomycetota bacterium]